jgi:serine/threonine protein kinase
MSTPFEENDFTGMVVRTEVAGQLELRALLGKGAAALVYRALNRDSGACFAVKVNRNEEALSSLLDVPPKYEVTVMRRLHEHPNVLGLLDSATLASYSCYVTMLADSGDLLMYLQRERVLNESLARDLFAQLAAAVGYAHQQGVVHRDIKLENLLLTSDAAMAHGFRLILADWGYAAPWSPGEPGLRDSCGSLHYCPPEVGVDGWWLVWWWWL